MPNPHQAVLDQLHSGADDVQAGERCLIEFLAANLDGAYEIYFQPFLNGDRPDVVVVLKGYGILIIEVKDWKLSNYHLDERRRWILKTNGTRVKSPIDQVLQYKENLFNLHVPGLLECKIRNFKSWAVVSCAVYFHCARRKEIEALLIHPFKDDEKYQKFIQHYDLLGCDNLTPYRLRDLLHQRYLSPDRPPSRWFTHELYNEFTRLLKPPLHTIEQGTLINYTPEQRSLIASQPREQRIKGVAGSGKTCVMAARAVAAHKRTGSNVLILTYNITLKNYIHDAISRVREQFSWSAFYITNYHQFAKAELNNMGIQFEVPDSYSDMSAADRSNYWEAAYFSNVGLFTSRVRDDHKYAVILIDEVQDYRYEWLAIIKQCFLQAGGEYVLLGDEKQNIYDTPLEQRDVRTNIKQRPTRMRQTFRLNQALADTTMDYQRHRMGDKYDLDNDMIVQRTLSYGLIEYREVFDGTALDILNTITDFLNRSQSHPNDTAIIGFTIALLRDYDCLYRHTTGHRTTTMFETEEIRRKILINSAGRPSSIRQGMKLIERRVRDDERLNALIAIWVSADIAKKYRCDATHVHFERTCARYHVKPDKASAWAADPTHVDLLNATSREFAEQIGDVREHKKFHFWGNAGTTKISTIHSFKGWEVETLVEIIEPRFENGEFRCSFDELIYTGFTRAKSNLLIINQGNTEHRTALRDVFGTRGGSLPSDRLKQILGPLLDANKAMPPASSL